MQKKSRVASNKRYYEKNKSKRCYLAGTVWDKRKNGLRKWASEQSRVKRRQLFKSDGWIPTPAFDKAIQELLSTNITNL